MTGARACGHYVVSVVRVYVQYAVCTYSVIHVKTYLGGGFVGRRCGSWSRPRGATRRRRRWRTVFFDSLTTGRSDEGRCGKASSMGKAATKESVCTVQSVYAFTQQPPPFFLHMMYESRAYVVHIKCSLDHFFIFLCPTFVARLQLKTF